MTPIAPNCPNLALQLPAQAYYHLVHTLNGTLPRPLTDNPEDLLRRNHAAIARIAALSPANSIEADLAGLYVAASEQWKDCLRLAQLPETSPESAMKCRAQAISMMRQAQSALRLLLRMQATRQKTEADSEACDRAAWTEHGAIRLMAEALSPPEATETAAEPPAPPPEPQPAPTEEPHNMALIHRIGLAADPSDNEFVNYAAKFSRPRPRAKHPRFDHSPVSAMLDPQPGEARTR